MANQCFDQKQESLEPEQEPSDKNELFHWILTLAIAVIIALCVNRFVLVNAEIPSGSMENTIMTGDRVFGNRLAYIFGEPKRFDIIIFRYPDDEKQLFIKRIIGLPGETVEIHDGQIFIDGKDKAVSIHSPQEAQKLGISTVYQEITLCPNLSVAENMYIGRSNKIYQNWKKMNEDADKILQNLDIPAKASQQLASCSIAVQQMVAIARAVDMDLSLIHISEPTRRS